MKAINRAMLITICCYCGLLILGALFIQHQKQEQIKQYNIELNRCHQQLQNGASPEELLAEGLRYVTEIHLLDADDYEGLDKDGFFSGYSLKSEDFRVYPLYREGEVKDFVRIAYQKDKTVEQAVLRGAFGAAVLSAVLCLSLLIWIRQRVIRPYLELNQRAGELTRGVFSDRSHTVDGCFGELSWKLGVLSKTLAWEKETRLKMERDKATLLASLSHDIKTPLQTIRLYSQALAENLLETKQEEKEAVLRIEEKAQQIDEIVKELMDQSEVLDKTLEIKMELFYLDKLLSSIQERWRRELELRSISFQLENRQNKLIKADWYRLIEVLDNILNNAVKYGDGKLIEIFVTEEEYHTAVHVRNTGDPCGKGELPFLFTSYWRGSNAKNKEGNGLGLSICKKLMQLMDGEIYALRGENSFEVILILEDGAQSQLNDKPDQSVSDTR